MRRRIVEAVLELHQTLGPARTTISDIARQARVQRLTVYRYFPDERSLLAACGAHYRAANPAPNPEAWREIPDAAERLRRALGELFGFYRATQAMFSKILRDAEVNPSVREASRGRAEYAARVAATLEPGWGARGRRKDLVQAAIRHAVDFRAWESLAIGQGLADETIVELLVGMVREAASPCPGRAARGGAMRPPGMNRSPRPA